MLSRSWFHLACVIRWASAWANAVRPMDGEVVDENGEDGDEGENDQVQ